MRLQQQQQQLRPHIITHRTTAQQCCVYTTWKRTAHTAGLAAFSTYTHFIQSAGQLVSRSAGQPVSPALDLLIASSWF